MEISQLFGMIFGLLGTTLGGVFGAFLNIKSDKIISFILQFASGLMMAVICFDLIPESLKIVNTVGVVLGIILGVIVMIFCNDIVGKKLSSNNSSNLLKVGIIIGIGLGIHNFPERSSYTALVLKHQESLGLL